MLTEERFEVTFRAACTSDLEQVFRIDDQAGELFATAGLDMSALVDEHPFVQAEHARLRRAAEAGLVELALDSKLAAIGFSALGSVDGRPYVEQLSVAPGWMRRKVGARLLQRAWAAAQSAGELWLTTYAHLPWNGPMYARAGFRGVAEAYCGPGIREILSEQRAALPDPEQRIAMVRRA